MPGLLEVAVSTGTPTMQASSWAVSCTRHVAVRTHVSRGTCTHGQGGHGQPHEGGDARGSGQVVLVGGLVILAGENGVMMKVSCQDDLTPGPPH